MCIIAVCNGTRLTLDQIDKMTATNRDGLGIAWIDRKTGKVRWRKGIGNTLAAEMASRLPFPYVLHARLATVGEATISLCHPHEIAPKPSRKIEGSTAAVLFHNGHVHDWRMLMAASGLPVPKGEANHWSDTRAIAAVIAQTGASILNHIDVDRFAYMDSSGVHLFGKWILDAGIEWSTTLAPTRASWSKYALHTVDDVDDDEVSTAWWHSMSRQDQDDAFERREEIERQELKEYFERKARASHAAECEDAAIRHGLIPDKRKAGPIRLGPATQPEREASAIGKGPALLPINESPPTMC